MHTYAYICFCNLQELNAGSNDKLIAHVQHGQGVAGVAHAKGGLDLGHSASEAD